MTSGAEQPARVGLVLHRAADADETIAAGEASQAIDLASDVRRGQVDEADHAADARLTRGEREQLLGLLDDRRRLDDDGVRDSCARGHLGEVGDTEASIDRRHVDRIDPRHLADLQVPQVMVRVDPVLHCP